MPDLRAKRELNNGFGNAQSRGIEMALTPVAFAGLGWLVDRALGTHLVFLVAFVVFSVVGLFVKAWIGYDADMRKHEAGQVWTRGREEGAR